MADNLVAGTGTGQGNVDIVAEQRKIMQMQQEQSLQNMRLQAEQSMQTERLATISNMMKNKHDSQMLIINNMKG